MKKLYLLVILVILTGCTMPYNKVNYRIRQTDGKYGYYTDSHYSNKVFLTAPKGNQENRREKGRIYIDLRIEDNNRIVIKSSREHYYVDIQFMEYTDRILKNTFGENTVVNWDINIPKEEFEYPEILNDIVIIKNNGKKIIIPTEKVIYEYTEKRSSIFDKKKKFTTRKIIVNLEEELYGPIILEIGKIKIRNKIYDVPKIYMQKYKGTYELLSSEHPNLNSRRWKDK